MLHGYNETYDKAARLAILRLLSEQADYRLSDSMLDELLVNRHAINRGRAYVRTQLAWLENSCGAVQLEEEGHSTIAELMQPGVDHVLRRHVIPGIRRPDAGRP